MSMYINKSAVREALLERYNTPDRYKKKKRVSASALAEVEMAVIDEIESIVSRQSSKGVTIN